MSPEQRARQKAERDAWRNSPEGKEAIRKSKAAAGKWYRQDRKNNPDAFLKRKEDREARKAAAEREKRGFDPAVGGEYDRVDLEGNKTREYRPGTQSLVDMGIWRGDNW